MSALPSILVLDCYGSGFQVYLPKLRTGTSGVEWTPQFVRPGSWPEALAKVTEFGHAFVVAAMNDDADLDKAAREGTLIDLKVTPNPEVPVF
jgi:hypothetical protein